MLYMCDRDLRFISRIFLMKEPQLHVGYLMSMMEVPSITGNRLFNGRISHPIYVTSNL